MRKNLWKELRGCLCRSRIVVDKVYNMNQVIIDVNLKNISHYPPTCFQNPDNYGYKTKLEWLKKRFSEGLKIKLLYFENDKKCHGYIEYIPGEYAWRAVNAKGYLFIHCIWIYPNNIKYKGLGSLLINECIKDAMEQKKNGVAIVTGKVSFMAEKDLFIKNKFDVVEECGPFTLLAKSFKKSLLPELIRTENQLKKYDGLNIVYSNQCPWVSKFILDVGEIIKKKNLSMKITEIKTAKQAQKSPSIYSVFNLIYNGRILADHYISTTRFLNIINKELKI
jgi:hypothetical protein